MANNVWTSSDSIEDIEANQPYGIMSLIEYGRSEPDTCTINQLEVMQNGYGHSIPNIAACSELAADIRQYKNCNNKMGELLTTEDILQLKNVHDEDIIDTAPEITAMLRSIGINNYSEAKFTKFRSEKTPKILSKPIVQSKGIPILLDDSFHKFERKPKVRNIIEIENETIVQKGDSIENETTLNNDTPHEAVSSGNVDSTYVGFSGVGMANKNGTHTRYKQTLVINKEIFHKPFQVYNMHKAKQNEKKKTKPE